MKSIQLTTGEKAKVDDLDFPCLRRFTWAANAYGYATHYRRVGNRNRTISMARAILWTPPGYRLDHINGDRLDNRRKNLRCVLPWQNRTNSGVRRDSLTRFKGVSLQNSRKRPFKAVIRVGGKLLWLGAFSSPKEAARAYDQAAQKHFGRFSRLNFPATCTAP